MKLVFIRKIFIGKAQLRWVYDRMKESEIY